MTKAQGKALERIKRLVEKEFYSDEYEIKKWEVNENDYFVSLILEYGMKGDEGTLAELFARDRAHLFIGKRGGVTYPVSKLLKSGKLKSYQKRFKGITILQAVIDQKI